MTKNNPNGFPRLPKSETKPTAPHPTVMPGEGRASTTSRQLMQSLTHHPPHAAPAPPVIPAKAGISFPNEQKFHSYSGQAPPTHQLSRRVYCHYINGPTPKKSKQTELFRCIHNSLGRLNHVDPPHRQIQTLATQYFFNRDDF